MTTAALHCYTVDGSRYALFRGQAKELCRDLHIPVKWSNGDHGWLVRAHEADDVLVLAELRGFLVRVHRSERVA